MILALVFLAGAVLGRVWPQPSPPLVRDGKRTDSEHHAQALRVLGELGTERVWRAVTTEPDPGMPVTYRACWVMMRLNLDHPEVAGELCRLCGRDPNDRMGGP